MTTKRIVFRRSDGIVEIVVPGLRYMAKLMAEGKTEDEAVETIRDHAFSKLSERGLGPPLDAEIVEASQIPETKSGDRQFRDALEKPGLGLPSVNMIKARTIQAGRISNAHAAEIARLKIEERKERLDNNTTQADAHAATIIALEALDLNVLATQVANAANVAALKAIWPAQVPRP